MLNNIITNKVSTLKSISYGALKAIIRRGSDNTEQIIPEKSAIFIGFEKNNFLYISPS